MIELASFLGRQTMLVSGSAVWGNGRFPLEMRTYLCAEEPPLALVTSVRAVVLQDQEVLVVQDAEGNQFVVPGGRREGDESLQETVRREVLEETGWEIEPGGLLALVHYHHLSPRPAGHPYPYPDFLQPIFLAEAVRFRPEVAREDEWVVASGFRPVAEVLKLPMERSQHLLLEAALQMRG